MLKRTVAVIVLVAAVTGAMQLLKANAAPAAKGRPAAAAARRLPKVDPSQSPSPQWVWGPGQARDDQAMYFRASFDSGLSPGQAPKSAVVWASCDNQVELFVNGKKGEQSTMWEEPIVADVTSAIEPGRNVIVARCKNEGGEAGLILKLQVTHQDGKVVTLVSDEKWKTSPDVAGDWWAKEHDDKDWRPARVVAAYGAGPWGKLPKVASGAGGGGRGGQPGKATAGEDLKLLPGFKAELLYSVPKNTQGSWVSMTPDPKGRLIVSDQAGPLFRVTVGKTPEDTKVEKIDLPIGHAQGLLWAHDGLYVTVNGRGIGGNSGGLYRLTYDPQSDKFTEIKTLKKFTGRGGSGEAGGEHGPHAVRLGPDGKLYLIAGNFTGIPEGLKSETSPFRNWAEDLLLPRNPDGGGHDPAIWAPAGWIARTDTDGKNWELLCAGMRNSYDFAFNADGEILVYDSDMEWDTGSPWYRPVRALMLTSGGEYGWRNGTGKWPDYYPDSLPPVANMGMGSPTGVEFGYGAKFPAKYQKALFCMDWAYGKLFALHLTPTGAGYKGTFEPFVEGKAWDGTDVVINHDGAMYVTIGGRNTQSGLYRITYTGQESTEPIKAEPNADGAEARKLRHELEQYHVKQDPKAVELAWPQLNSRDRYLRFAARVALERQDLEQWQEKAFAERKPTAVINAMVGLVRAATADSGGHPENGAKANTPLFAPNPGNDGHREGTDLPYARGLQPKVLEALNRLSLQSLSEEQQLEALRAYALAFIRLGRPTPDLAAPVASKLEPLYPSQSVAVNRELVQLLVYLDVPSVVGKSMKLLSSAQTQEDQLHYVLALRMIGKGWTPEHRKAYFSWLNYAEKNYRGGNSFRRFLMRIREDAVKTLTPEEKQQLEDVLKGGGDAVASVVKATPPRQFVRNWQMADLVPVIEQSTKGRNFERGKAAYEATQCAKCHRFANEGGSSGPDLSGLGNRFQPIDVLENIIHPSKVVSDQYQTTDIVTKDGDVFVGHIEGEDEQGVNIRTNPLSAEVVTVAKNNIKERRPSKVSLMPEGLLDYLSQDEVLDLIAYLRSGGNREDKAFSK